MSTVALAPAAAGAIVAILAKGAGAISAITALTSHAALLAAEAAEAAVLVALAGETAVAAKGGLLLLLLLLRSAGLRRANDTVRSRAGTAGLAKRRRGTALRVVEGLQGFVLSSCGHGRLLSVGALSETRCGASKGISHTAEPAGLVERASLCGAAAIIIETAASKVGAHAAGTAHRGLLVLAKSTSVCWRRRVLIISRAIRSAVHATLPAVTSVPTTGLAVSKLILIGLLVRAVVVGVTVRESSILVVAGSLVHRMLGLGRRDALLLGSAGDRVGSVVAGAGGFAVAGLGLLGFIVR